MTATTGSANVDAIRRQLLGVLRWVGLLLSISALVFVGIRFRDYGAQLGELKWNPPMALFLVLIGAGHCVVILCLAAAWRRILVHLGVSRSLNWAIRIHGISQLAKYIPGNVFHFASRQAIGMADGVSTVQLAKSAIWEIGTISFAAVLFVVFLIVPDESAVSTTSFAAAALVATGIFRRIFSKQVAVAFLLYLLFLLLSGILFLFVLKIVSPGLTVGFGVVCGAYVVSWLAGLVTPGAPAGLGIREVFLYAFLQSSISHPDLLAAVALSRLMTVVGDLAFYSMASSLPGEKSP